MQRWLFVLPGALAVWAAGAQWLLAADASTGWPSISAPFTRGTGAYLSPYKILICWLVFLAWVRTTDWINEDAQLMKLRYTVWNPIVFFSFFAALLLFWLLPWFAVGITLILIAWVAPLVSYIVSRNRQVQLYDKVLTKKHLHRWFAQKVAKIGIKMEGADVDPRDQGPQVKLTPMGGATDRDNSVNLLTARQSPGWMPARALIDEVVVERATHAMLDYTAESVGLRYQIDGVWQDRSSLEREEGDSILAVLKGLAAMKVEDRRSRQSGSIGLEVEKEKYTAKLTSQGTQTGERVLVQIEPKKLAFKTLEDIGMRAKMVEQLDEILGQSQGMLIFSAMPGGGMSTMFDLVIMHCDRYMRSFVTTVDPAKPERDIENLHASPFSPSAGETPATMLPTMIRTYPDVIAVRDVADLETLSILCEQADKRLLLTTVRAKEAVEALLRLMMLKIPPQDFAMAATAVLNVRLVRKLCDKCKEAYPPPPEVLKQLGLPAGRIEALYRPGTTPAEGKDADKPCEQCRGVGYFGRTGIFELLIVNDELRQALVATPKLENLRAVARKAKHRNLQEEGVLLVAKGVTSLQELLRVLKQ